jgi:hypothetical protein
MHLLHQMPMHRLTSRSRDRLRSVVDHVKVELENQPSQTLDFSVLGDRAPEIKTAIEAIQTRGQLGCDRRTDAQ